MPNQALEPEETNSLPEEYSQAVQKLTAAIQATAQMFPQIQWRMVRRQADLAIHLVLPTAPESLSLADLSGERFVSAERRIALDLVSQAELTQLFQQLERLFQKAPASLSDLVVTPNYLQIRLYLPNSPQNQQALSEWILEQG